jgi:hypothetical protein
VGAFAVSFIALRDLMQVIGYSPAIAWIFPAIIDTTVAVSTMMLVALGDKPARRLRGASASPATHTPLTQTAGNAPMQSAKSQVDSALTNSGRVRATPPREKHASASIQPDAVQAVQVSAHSETAQVDADLAAELIASRATTQPVETVIAVLAARRRGASINAAAKVSGINYRTAQRIVEATEAGRQRLSAVS